jgi:hypothetical protein
MYTEKPPLAAACSAIAAHASVRQCCGKYMRMLPGQQHLCGLVIIVHGGLLSHAAATSSSKVIVNACSKVAGGARCAAETRVKQPPVSGCYYSLPGRQLCMRQHMVALATIQQMSAANEMLAVRVDKQHSNHVVPAC